jgi:alpha-L-glutamate ligase-like protein
MARTWRALKERGIMGINQRNADYIVKYNQRRYYPLVDNKILTKQRALAWGISVPELYAVLESEHQIRNLDRILGDYADFVIKPAQGSGGDGIAVIAGKFDETRYKTVSGRIVGYAELQYQISNILTGLYSLGGARDKAMIEYRVRPDPVFSSISYEGVPDIRIIVLMGYPVMAMLRLPTRQSNGKANLHQGAIGVGIDLAGGTTLNGTWLNEKIDRHPDTAVKVSGISIPLWEKFIHLATNCYELVNLGYIGVDLVLDETLGPLILELNARPGLSIQIANDAGLYARTRLVEERLARRAKAGQGPEGPEERIEFSQRFLRTIPLG